SPWRSLEGRASGEAPNGLERHFDLVVAVRRREEHRLVLRRREVDAASEETLEQRWIVVDEKRRHRTDSLEAAVLCEPVEPLPLLLELLVHLWREAPQDREAGRRRERVSRQRPRLVDVAGRSEALH